MNSLKPKSQLLRHAPDDFQVDGLGILLVVNGKQGYASLMLGDDGLAVMTRALPLLPRPLEVMGMRILRMPGLSSAP